MKKIILTLILMLTFITNVNASIENKLIKEININQFETVLVNVPSRVIYHYCPIYGFSIKLENNDFDLSNDNFKINNNNGKLGINIQNLSTFELQDFYNSSPDNIIIHIYSPDTPNIKTSSRDLWISGTYKKTSTKNEKN